MGDVTGPTKSDILKGVWTHGEFFTQQTNRDAFAIAAVGKHVAESLQLNVWSYHLSVF
jgi:hypothetical protein